MLHRRCGRGRVMGEVRLGMAQERVRHVQWPAALAATPNSLGRAYHAVLQHTRLGGMSLSETMGRTVMAFKLHIRRGSVETDSVYSFHGGPWMGRGFELLGMEPLILIPPVRTITPEGLAELIGVMRERLDAGVPFIGWDLFAKRFGVITGYDDTRQVFYAADGVTDGEIAYDALPNRRILCLGTVSEQRSAAPLGWRDGLRRTLEAVVDHAYERDGMAFNNVASGLAAYDAWIESFEAGDAISRKGNAWNLQIAADARQHAAAFLEHLHRQAAGDALQGLLEQAADRYRIVAKWLDDLAAYYPYPLRKSGKDPRDPELAACSIVHLQRARQAEAEGVAILADIADQLSR